MIRLTLPWAVLAQANHRLTPRRGGRGLTLAPAYRRAKEAAETLLIAQRRVAPATGPVSVTLWFHEPDARRRDPSNLQKLIEDALSGIAYVDDSQIVEMHWRRAGIDRKRPRVEIEVCEVVAA
jgi:Holliday junction resolvase RusA-like endonuclease